MIEIWKVHLMEWGCGSAIEAQHETCLEFCLQHRDNKAETDFPETVTSVLLDHQFSTCGP